MPITSDPNTPFFDPRATYGWAGSVPFGQTQLGDVFRNDTNPEGEFTRWLASQGYGGVDTKSEQARSLLSRFEAGYGAVKTTNPQYKWTDYLAGINLPDVFAGMSPEARGEQASRYTGPIRWAMRQE
jgi:hypothetical protein